MSTHRRYFLANETWTSSFSHLSLHDLASVSRVSKTWQALAFPHLYHTVCLTVAEHLEALAKRIESDRDGPLSLRVHICGLIFDEYERKIETAEAGDSLKDDDLGCLLEIVPKLSSLRYFSWEMEFFPEDMEIISVLQAANLQSVDWWVWQCNSGDNNVLEERPDDFLDLLKFKDLTHLRLRVRQIPTLDFHEDFKDPIASCLMASPNLESLTLEFCNVDDMKMTWSPEIIIDTLGDFTFPSLRTFRALGDPDGWSGLTKALASNSLVSFFTRHPQLHTVSLALVEDCVYDCDEPEAFAALFPAIRHIEAPMVMCKAMMLSGLAGQLESVIMVDKEFEHDGDDRDLNTLEGLKVMQNLRKFAINGEDDVTPIEVDSLKMLLGFMPNLQELGTEVLLDEPTRLLELLKLAPKLRTLNLPFDTYDTLKTELEATDLEECVPALIEACPLLRCIAIPMHSEGSPFLIVERESGGDLRVFKSATR